MSVGNLNSGPSTGLVVTSSGKLGCAVYAHGREGSQNTLSEMKSQLSACGLPTHLHMQPGDSGDLPALPDNAHVCPKTPPKQQGRSSQFCSQCLSSYLELVTPPPALLTLNGSDACGERHAEPHLHGGLFYASPRGESGLFPATSTSFKKQQSQSK
ncbi:hypothetical protein SKAU_G00074380 [Synaphobranchus kaupii]|uniref:Uncharacterized protein n=1 Tax=Synaphobranchus kaupii TaxID=118154 RepID=A0A9Q1G888_SYNKA|nr:hypothetical protein SKAU_G00074380 [Synaphobranchus kaupii]